MLTRSDKRWSQRVTETSNALDLDEGVFSKHDPRSNCAVTETLGFVESDLLSSVAPERQFDFIVSNPPYVTTAEMDQQLMIDVREFEPRTALEAGPKGTEVIQRLLPQAAERLVPGGWLLMEISPQLDPAVRQLVEADGRFELSPTMEDLAGHPRVIPAQRRGWRAAIA